MHRFPWFTILATFVVCGVFHLPPACRGEPPAASSATSPLAGYRGPVDVALTHDGRTLLTVNQLSNSVSVIDVASRAVVAEQTVSGRPTTLALVDTQSALVSCTSAGVVEAIRFDTQGVDLTHRFEVGFEPLGLAVDRAKARAYVGLVAAGQVAELDLKAGTVTRRIAVGPWPRYLTLSPASVKLVPSTDETR